LSIGSLEMRVVDGELEDSRVEVDEQVPHVDLRLNHVVKESLY